MERPGKRCRVWSLDYPSFDLQNLRALNDLRLKSAFEVIFEKYSKDFSQVGDEIDLRSGKLVVDNGHIAGMQHEVDVGYDSSSMDELGEELYDGGNKREQSLQEMLLEGESSNATRERQESSLTKITPGDVQSEEHEGDYLMGDADEADQHDVKTRNTSCASNSRTIKRRREQTQSSKVNHQLTALQSQLAVTEPSIERMWQVPSLPHRYEDQKRKSIPHNLLLQQSLRSRSSSPAQSSLWTPARLVHRSKKVPKHPHTLSLIADGQKEAIHPPSHSTVLPDKSISSKSVGDENLAHTPHILTMNKKRKRSPPGSGHGSCKKRTNNVVAIPKIGSPFGMQAGGIGVSSLPLDLIEASVSRTHRHGHGYSYSPAEDRLLYDLRVNKGLNWKEIYTYFPGRIGLSLIHHWRRIRSKDEGQDGRAETMIEATTPSLSSHKVSVKKTSPIPVVNGSLQGRELLRDQSLEPTSEKGESPSNLQKTNSSSPIENAPRSSSIRSSRNHCHSFESKANEQEEVCEANINKPKISCTPDQISSVPEETFQSSLPSSAAAGRPLQQSIKKPGWTKWTPEEDEKFMSLKMTTELNWAEISLHFPQRSPSSLQYRWSACLKDRARREMLKLSPTDNLDLASGSPLEKFHPRSRKLLEGVPANHETNTTTKQAQNTAAGLSSEEPSDSLSSPPKMETGNKASESLQNVEVSHIGKTRDAETFRTPIQRASLDEAATNLTKIRQSRKLKELRSSTRFRSHETQPYSIHSRDSKKSSDLSGVTKSPQKRTLGKLKSQKQTQGFSLGGEPSEPKANIKKRSSQLSRPISVPDITTKQEPYPDLEAEPVAENNPASSLANPTTKPTQDFEMASDPSIQVQGKKSRVAFDLIEQKTKHESDDSDQHITTHTISPLKQTATLKIPVSARPGQSASDENGTDNLRKRSSDAAEARTGNLATDKHESTQSKRHPRTPKHRLNIIGVSHQANTVPGARIKLSPSVASARKAVSAKASRVGALNSLSSMIGYDSDEDELSRPELTIVGIKAPTSPSATPARECGQVGFRCRRRVCLRCE